MVTAHSLRTLFDRFLLVKEADGLSPRTLEAHRLMFNNIIRDSPPEKLQNVMELTPQDFQEWVIDLR